MIAFLRWLQFPVHEFAITDRDFWKGYYWSGYCYTRTCKHCGRQDYRLSRFDWQHLSGPLACTIEPARDFSHRDILRD